MAEAMEVTEFEQGTVVFKQGDVGDRFYIIKEGSVTLSKTEATGQKHTVTQLNAGASFGERALIKDEVR